MTKTMVLAAAALLLVVLTGGGAAQADAICEDGTYSDADGQGACSWHGGVDEWITHSPQAATGTTGNSDGNDMEGKIDWTGAVYVGGPALLIGAAWITGSAVRSKLTDRK